MKLDSEYRLHFIKLLHTLIWTFFNVVIFYIVYAVFTNRIDYRLWICYGLILGEGLTLAFFRLLCPLTVWARKYSASTSANFDIYLPEWLAKYNKEIYTTIVLIPTIYLIYKQFQ